MDAPSSNPSGLPRWFGPVFAVALIGFGASVVAMLALAGRTPTKSETPNAVAALFEPTPGLEGLSVPDFQLVDQGGNPVDASVFEGHYTLLSFVFTNCVLVCPDLTGTMLELHLAFDKPPIRSVSISVDPAYDTPQVLSEYAARYGADTSRWSFLTDPNGDPAEVRRIAREGLLFELSLDPNAANAIVRPDGVSMANIIHPSSVLLIGPDRRVLGRYSYQFPEEIEALKKRLGAIVAVKGGN